MLADLQKQLGIDATLGVQFLIFFFVYLWMRLVFFAPYQRLQDARRQKTSGLKDAAQALEDEAQALEASHKDRLMAARKEVAGTRDRLTLDARARASAVAEGARKEMKQKMDSARDLTQRAAAQGLVDLDAQVEALSDVLVDKLTNTRMGL